VTTHPDTVLALANAQEAADAIARLTGTAQHDVALVLGSGWTSEAGRLGPSGPDIPVTDLPHFARASAEGHAGTFRSVDVGGTRVLVFMGRTHLYEGHGVDAVGHRMRTAAAAGCRAVILTNACGSINPDWPAGTPALISDHINFTGVSPLHGAHFVDLTDLYSARLRRLCQGIEPSLAEGVYIQFPGPMYETAAEIAMSRAMGAQLVGMSTALEAIVARSVGLEILGLSLVTNLATGIATKPHSHTDVLAEGQAAAGRMIDLLARVIREM
jgi:purine-nucleoside phosphorylase